MISDMAHILIHLSVSSILDHEAYTQEIITNPTTEINAILRKVAPDFPDKVASVINHSYPNKQVVQLISSQIDCDRMDYLLEILTTLLLAMDNLI